MKKNEVIKQDDRLSFYIYQISQEDHTQLGFLALANIDDFLCHKIKGHENTLVKRMNERASQMINIETQIGPIYMSYPDDKNINFESDDWDIISEEDAIKEDYEIIKNSMDLSLYWAKRSKKAFGINPHKALFGIVQGGLFKDLRIKSLKKLIID